jgi:hypothetical protein
MGRMGMDIFVWQNDAVIEFITHFFLGTQLLKHFTETVLIEMALKIYQPFH